MEDPAALGAGSPIVIVGESLEEHRAGRAIEVVLRQLRTAFDLASRRRIALRHRVRADVGDRNGPFRRAGSIRRRDGRIRDAVPGLENVQILYGGSMKPANAVALMEQPNIDGGLVGGASLEVDPFLRIIERPSTRAANMPATRRLNARDASLQRAAGAVHPRRLGRSEPVRNAIALANCRTGGGCWRIIRLDS